MRKMSENEEKMGANEEKMGIQAENHIKRERISLLSFVFKGGQGGGVPLGLR